ncbi:MAG: TetR/AcrR family transcriptional regulator [Leptospiraceae bacterium]|nr:TetR/AcrR family transcriptional regulator [Leptospiraceae bacterium]
MGRKQAFANEEILEIAMKLFWVKGFHATSIDDLVHELGINRSSIYHCYGGKKELFFKALEQFKNQSFSKIKANFENTTSIKKSFLRLFESTIDFLNRDKSRNGCLLINTITELVPEDKELELFLQKNKMETEKLFIEMIEKGIQTGEFKNCKNPEGLGQILFTIHSGLGVIYKFPNKVDYKKNLLQQIEKLLN